MPFKKHYLALLVTFAIISIWVLMVQPNLFASVIPFSMTNNDLQDWLGAVFVPTNWVVYSLGIICLLIWFGWAKVSRWINAKAVLSNRFWWWLLLVLYGLFSLIVFFAISFFTGWLNDGQSLEPLFIVPPFILFDITLLYWLPTALATPRSLRYVPPLSMTLRKLYGG